MDEIKEQKCNYCKVVLPIYKFSTNRADKYLKSCDECRNKQKKNREKNKCPHGRQKSVCKQCGGASICEHNRIRICCKQCGGSSICEHGRRRSDCKECGGTSICEHGRQRSHCKECEGGSICEHGRMRNTCKECGGSSICEHGRRRYECKECGGASICEHGRQKRQCKDCMNDEEKIEFIQKTMISHSREKDKKHNRYNADHFIDKPFLESLFEDSQNCHYCNVDFTYNKRCNTLVTIERLNNSIGHIKSNCVLACLNCNCRHTSRDESVDSDDEKS